jgi:V/A-type H+/Na+-transporting ATPase subunit I
MFYPEKMTRVTIISPKTHMKGVIDALYDLKVLHIRDYIPDESGLGMGTPLKDAEKISEIMLDIQNIKSHIKPPPISIYQKFNGTEKYVKKVKSKVNSIASEISSISEKIKSLEKEKEDLKFLSNAGVKDLGSLGGYRNFELVFGYSENPENIKGTAVIYSKKVGKKYPVIVLVKKGQKVNIEEIKISLASGGKTVHKIRETEEEMEKLREKLSENEKKLKSIGTEDGPRINHIEFVLMEKIKKSEAPLKFASSEFAFLVNGWMPDKNKNNLIERLYALNKNIFVKFEEVTDPEEVPVKMNNPDPVRSFEFFLQLYSLPKYHEIEPSFLIFLSFPFFFGFMLGDIGYGLVILALSLILRSRKKSALLDIMILASMTTMFFGIVFGEFFGSEEILGLHLTPFFHRLEHINQLIVVSAIIGLVHINMGIILGFINELRHHGFMRAATAKLSWIGIELAGILFIFNSTGILAVNNIVIGGLFVLSLIGLIKGEGAIGIVELPSLLSNVLSYFRLAAIGLASAALAIVVNNLAGPMFNQGGFMVLVGVLVLVVGHTINLALGIIGPFLQSMRLHYVEMFTKFYKGSGKSYEPFGK